MEEKNVAESVVETENAFVGYDDAAQKEKEDQEKLAQARRYDRHGQDHG